MGSSAELGRRAMGGVGAMGTREREEESVRFMALFHYERMAQHVRAYGATRTSAWRNTYERWTRDHERSREKKFLASGKNFVDGC